MANVFDQFDAVNGANVFDQFDAARAAPEMTYGEQAMDIAKSLGTGVVKGVTYAAGMPADIGRTLGEYAIRGGGYLMGADPEKMERDIARAREITSSRAVLAPPTSEELASAYQGVFGDFYQPRGTAGEYAETIGEFVPAAIAGPGGIIRKTVTAVVPGAASEAAGQAVRGTALEDLEPVARIAAGVVGGGLASIGAKGAPGRAMRKEAPEKAKIEAKKDTLYKELENSGVRFDRNEYTNFAADISARLQREGFDPDLHPKTAVILKKIGQLNGKSPSFVEMDTIRKMVGEVSRGGAGVDPADANRAVQILKSVDQFFDTAPVTTTSAALSPSQVNAKAKEARELSRRLAITRELEEMKRQSPYYGEGTVTGAEQTVRNYMRSKKGKRLTEAEQNAFNAIAMREQIAELARSKAGPFAGGAVGFFGGGGPVGAAVGAGLTLAGQAAVKKIAEANTLKQINKALKTVLAGRDAQNKMLRDAAVATARNRMRALLGAEAAAQSAMDNAFITDAYGNQYDVQGNRLR